MPNCGFCCHLISIVELDVNKLTLNCRVEANELLTAGKVLRSHEFFLVLKFLAIVKCIAGVLEME